MTATTAIQPRSEHRRRRRRLAVAVVAVLSVATVLYSVPRYLVGAEIADGIELREDLALHGIALTVHAVSAGLALLLGPFNFIARIRASRPLVHRTLGRIYLLAVLVGSLSGMVVGVLTLAGPIALVSFVLLDIAWFATGLAAYRAIRARRVADHRRWMLRNMALTFAAFNLRLYLGVFIAAQIPLLDGFYGGDFDALFAVAYNAAIVLSILGNAIFMEVFLRRRRAAAPISAGSV